MKRGLYRLIDPILGEAARVDKSAGDAAPYLSRYLYELLEFEPEFDCLPFLPLIPTTVQLGEKAPHMTLRKETSSAGSSLQG